MIHLWEDKGKSWSAIVWPKLIAVIPECVWPGMTYCIEQMVSSVSPFYHNCAKSFTYLNRLDVCSLRPRNIWGTEAFPQINQSLIILGYVQIGDLPVRDGVIDYQAISMAAQHKGFMENFFLIYASLQTKLKPYLGCESHPLDFPTHLPMIAKRLLQVERQSLISLSAWEVILGHEISFEHQQRSFLEMIHHCKLISFMRSISRFCITSWPLLL